VAEVIDQVMASDTSDGDESEEDCIKNETVPSVDKEIEACVALFNSDSCLGENKEAFKSSLGRLIKGTYNAFLPPSDPLKVILNTSVNCGPFFLAEGKVWLSKIKLRLNGRTTIRNPHQGEIVRVFPADLFLCLRKAIQHTRNPEISNSVCYGENKKGYVISFTSLESVVALFTLLTDLTKTHIYKTYFKRSLSGRVNGKAKVIINEDKDFAFHFKIKSSELHINFHYGVWNKAGFALHS